MKTGHLEYSAPEGGTYGPDPQTFFHPERTVLYRVLFHYFDRFLAEYESRFEKEYGYFRPIIREVVACYLDCGNPRCGFARVRCPDCPAEHLLMFSCRTRGLMAPEAPAEYLS